MVNVHFIYALLIQCYYTKKTINVTTFYYNAFPMHALNYAVVSGLCLHVQKVCKCLPAKNETLPFKHVIVSPLHTTWH